MSPLSSYLQQVRAKGLVNRPFSGLPESGTFYELLEAYESQFLLSSEGTFQLEKMLQNTGKIGIPS